MKNFLFCQVQCYNPNIDTYQYHLSIAFLVNLTAPKKEFFILDHRLKNQKQLFHRECKCLLFFYEDMLIY